MDNNQLILRVATQADIPAVKALMALAIEQLQKDYLTQAQIKASFASMGLDTQLIEDGTYFCVMSGPKLGPKLVAPKLVAPKLVGCGGWSYRDTLYGGNHSAGRSIRRLDPTQESARIRAMYTDPDYIKRGIGRMILDAGERAAREAGFRALVLSATKAGELFYRRCGYTVEREWEDANGAVPVPYLTMVKQLTSEQ